MKVAFLKVLRSNNGTFDSLDLLQIVMQECCYSSDICYMGLASITVAFAQSKSWSFSFRCSVLNKTRLLSEGIIACLALHSPRYLVSMLVSLIIVIICY